MGGAGGWKDVAPYCEEVEPKDRCEGYDVAWVGGGCNGDGT